MGTVLKGAFRISIHALREESDMDGWHKAQAHMISIHALREESDRSRPMIGDAPIDISIHALREESDLRERVGVGLGCHFNPRSP